MRSAAARLLLVGGAPYAWLSRRLAHALCDVASGVISHVAVRPGLHLDERPHAALGIRVHLGAGAGNSLRWRHEQKVNDCDVFMVTRIDRLARSMKHLRKEWSYIEAETFAQRAMAWVGQAHNPWLCS
jgi:hypothetical protein